MFLRAKSLAPNDSTVYQHYGESSLFASIVEEEGGSKFKIIEF